MHFARRPDGRGPAWGQRDEVQRQSPFDRLDFDHDGKVTKDEVMKMYAQIDKNSDGGVTRQELIEAIVSGATQNKKTDEKSAEGHHRMRHEHDGERRPHGPPTASSMMDRFDKDKKGSLTKSDVPERVWNRISKADSDNDGSVTKDELESHLKTMRSSPPRHGTETKSNDSPKGEAPKESKPQEPKSDDTGTQPKTTDVEQPLDATAASNVASSR